MVSTRQHPKDFPSPPRRSRSPSVSNGVTSRKWVHTPSTAVILWLIVSVPLVAWDAGYVLLRPHSMPGNKLHSPIWTPYALYGAVDYIYGWPAFDAHNGFTAAQTVLNVFESAAYIYYLTIVYLYGVSVTPSNKNEKKSLGRLISMVTNEKVVSGRIGSTALLVAYSASLMTLGKTILYWLNEYFSGFANIGHNDAYTLIFLWIIPNGLWIIFPSYNVYVLGTEIVASLDGAKPIQKAARSKTS